jgi:hypothetical protein
MPANDDLYSKRMSRERGELPDLFVHNIIPLKLRRQVILIFEDAFKLNDPTPSSQSSLNRVVDALRLAYGMLSLAPGLTKAEELFGFFDDAPVEQALDVIQRCMRELETLSRLFQKTKLKSLVSVKHPADVAAQLNARFKEAGVGFQYERGLIMRVDSGFLQDQVIMPALLLLSVPAYEGADDEFRKAHEHYRHGRAKEAINECLKAIESTLKVICTKRGWTFEKTDAAKRLIAIVFKHGLLPAMFQTQFSSFQTLLESGVPTLRNRTSGHGQGEQVVDVPGYFVSYALHLTATTIVFLVQAEQDSSRKTA